MEITAVVDVTDVKEVVVETLGLESRAETLNPQTPLFGALPELDSMAVLELILELEQRFGIVVEGEDVTTEVFESLASLTAFVNGKVC